MSSQLALSTQPAAQRCCSSQVTASRVAESITTWHCCWSLASAVSHACCRCSDTRAGGPSQAPSPHSACPRKTSDLLMHEFSEDRSHVHEPSLRETQSL